MKHNPNQILALAAIGMAYIRWYGAAKGYDDIDPGSANDAILREAERLLTDKAEPLNKEWFKDYEEGKY